MAEMKSRVHLVPEQEEKLNGILDESKMLFDQVREKYRPEMRAIYHAQVAKVKAMLSPEQLPEYEKILAERERARAEAEKKAK